MPTLEQVEKQIKALATVDTFWTRKEIKHLPEVLFEGEEIRHLVSGLMEGSTWLIVCTDHRVVLLDKGLLYGLKMKEFQLKSISSVEQSTGVFFGEIAITVSGSRMKIENLSKHAVRPFVEALNKARAATENSASQAKDVPSPPVSEDDMVSKLERLASLLDRGVLTEAEFAEQKKRILAAV